jgi:hypothetical protein
MSKKVIGKNWFINNVQMQQYKKITKVSSLRYLKLRRNCRESKGIKSKHTKNHTVSCDTIE